MLPQQTRIKSVSKPMASFPRQDSREARGQVEASAILQATQDNAATMPPPSKLQTCAILRRPDGFRRMSSKLDSSTIGPVLRQPSTSRKSSRDLDANGAYPRRNLRDISEPRPQARASSGDSDLQSNAKESYDGRSLSQQVRLKAPSDLLHSKALPQRQSSMKRAKPAFSAMQQQSSPKKIAQLDPSMLSPQPTIKDTSSSDDIFHLQMELAQLHLLHRSVPSVQAQWEKSAKGSLEHQFRALYERHVELKEIAYQQQTLTNQLSLVHWSQGRSSAQIAEKVQLLSHNVSDICNLLDLDGKYTHILEIFESWFAQALRVRGHRESNGRETGSGMDLIDGIGDGWKAEAMVLERELAYSARDLESFGEASKTSSLCRLLSIYRKLVHGLLEELDLIQWIESEIMSQETVWIQKTIHKLASTVSGNIGFMGPNRRAV